MTQKTVYSIIYGLMLVVIIPLIGITAYHGYEMHVQNVAIEKNLARLARSTWEINGKDLEQFLETHPDYQCHLYMKQGKHKEFRCYEPTEQN